MHPNGANSPSGTEKGGIHVIRPEMCMSGEQFGEPGREGLNVGFPIGALVESEKAESVCKCMRANDEVRNL
jgi:hypothetical protein